MIYRPRTVLTTDNGAELGTHGTSLIPVAAYDNDFTNFEVIWHWHRELEFIHMLKGSLLVSLPNEQIILNSGEIIFINSEVMHAAVNAGCGECLLHSAVFLPEFLCNGVEGVFWQKYICPLIDNKRLRSLVFSRDSEETVRMQTHMEQFWEACRKEPFGYEFIIRDQLSNMICNVASDCKMDIRPVSSRQKREDERVKKMLEFIHDHYMSEITTKMLASSANISESECLRCFRNVLGITPIQYVKKYRLQIAADMLMATDYTITEVAGQCGFGHMSYFARVFQDRFGMTPRQYRSRTF
ncbi:MAG: helix-turn-helix domain-containing protein [Lachnospiraceae bacterium]